MTQADRRSRDPAFSSLGSRQRQGAADNPADAADNTQHDNTHATMDYGARPNTAGMQSSPTFGRSFGGFGGPPPTVKTVLVKLEDRVADHEEMLNR